MPEAITKFLNKVKAFWTQMDKSQKTRIFIMAGILAAALIISLVLTHRVEYVPLFDEGEEVDLKPVVNYLDENNIKYKKGDNQIFVDSKKKQDIEFDLTTQGVVSPDVSFSDAWSQLSLTATEKDKENLWQNYLTNNLVYKLKKFENVKNATVQYSKPEKTYFVRPDEEDDQQGSAYVMLDTVKALTPDQVNAAALVVASSLGIPPEKITIVDENLNLLTTDQQGSKLATAGTQDDMRRQREMELEKKVYDFFKIGIADNENFDTLSVSANAVLDFDTLKSTSTKYTAPDEDGEGFTKNKETLEETVTNADAGAAPGTDANPQTAPSYQIGGDENSQYNKNHNVEERLFNQTNEEAEKSVGKLMPDQSTMSISLWYGSRIQSDEGLTPEYIEQVKQNAYAATGIPAENISVSIQKLAAPKLIQPTLSDTLSEFFDKYGLYLIMLILLIVMVIVAMPRKKPVPDEVSAAAQEAAAGSVSEAEAMEHMKEIKDIGLDEDSELKKQIEKFVKENPDAVAQLLRNWIEEDWE